MEQIFDDLNDINLDEYPGFDLIEYNTLYNEEYDLSLVRHDNKWYAVNEEDEPGYVKTERGKYIYETTLTWYSRFNLKAFLKDVKNGDVTPDDFYVEEYV